MGNAQAHIEIAEPGLVLVEPDAVGRLRRILVEPELVDIALVEELAFRLLVPEGRRRDAKGVELALPEVFPGQVHVANHRHLDLVHIVAVAEVFQILCPPVLLALEGNALAFLDLVDLVGTGVGHDLPVVLLHEALEVFRALVEMLRRRADAEVGIELIARSRLGAGYGNGERVVDDHLVQFLAVEGVVPGRDDMLGAHEFQRKSIVLGRHRLAVGPARLRVELEIHGLVVIPIGPVGGQGRQQLAGIRMQGDQRHLVV